MINYLRRQEEAVWTNNPLKTWTSCHHASSWTTKCDFETILLIEIMFKRFQLYSLTNKKNSWKISQPCRMAGLGRQIIKVGHFPIVLVSHHGNFKSSWINERNSRIIRTASYCLPKRPNLLASHSIKKNIRNAKSQNPNISPSTPSASLLKMRSLWTLRVRNTIKISLTFWFTNVKRWVN